MLIANFQIKNGKAIFRKPYDYNANEIYITGIFVEVSKKSDIKSGIRCAGEFKKEVIDISN